MTRSARDNILQRIQAVTKSSPEVVAQRISEPPVLIRPGFSEKILDRFSDKLALGGGTLQIVKAEQSVSAAIEVFLETQQLPQRIKLAPALKSMQWSEQIETSYGRSDGDDLVSLAPAFCAIAETGSVVLLSSSESPTSLNFLPDVHIVIVKASQLVVNIEDAWSKLRELERMPRAVNIITGPSKTADIEQTLQIGAHGPRKLHVVFVDDE
ncbi:MAG: lactate utilization protein [Gammaproteobacteria bacterium]|nr:lactate utilization protein [Gammaproteobacteria bacterium]